MARPGRQLRRQRRLSRKVVAPGGLFDAHWNGLCIDAAIDLDSCRIATQSSAWAGGSIDGTRMNFRPLPAKVDRFP